jgi:hypothetical protein
MEANSKVPTRAFSVVRLALAGSWLDADGTPISRDRNMGSFMMAE